MKLVTYEMSQTQSPGNMSKTDPTSVALHGMGVEEQDSRGQSNERETLVVVERGLERRIQTFHVFGKTATVVGVSLAAAVCSLLQREG